MQMFGRWSAVSVLMVLAMLVAPGVGYAAGTVSTSGTAASAGKTSSSHVIVFQTSSGGPIYVMNPDGRNLRRLTTGMDPALSPDGKQVAFTRWDGQGNGTSGSLWVINLDGTDERQVVASANQPKSPTWSADGKQIVISMQQGGTLHDSYICIVNGMPVEVPNPADGQRCRLNPANPWWGLRLVDVATGEYKDLPRDTHSFAPTWDPANAWHVVFRGDKGLESLDLNLGTTWTLKSNGAYRGPVFSPDGKKIAVTFNQNDHWEVHVLNADGTGEVRLTETPSKLLIDQLLAGKTPHSYDNAAPAWSPDGKQIAFISNRNGAYEIWVMNADGSNQHVLLSAKQLGGAGIQYDGNDERVISWR
jgi:Tol biopolymer transport system component